MEEARIWVVMVGAELPSAVRFGVDLEFVEEAGSVEPFGGVLE